jgi:hypothetical protein
VDQLGQRLALFAMIDLFSRRRVGWSIGTGMKTQLAADAALFAQVVSPFDLLSDLSIMAVPSLALRRQRRRALE